MAEQETVVFTEPKPLTEAQRKARWEELRNRPMRSALYVRCWNRDVYVRWVRKDDPNDIATHEAMGFKIAVDHPMKDTPNKHRFDYATKPNAEGHFVNGDVILMEGSRVDYEFYCKENEDLSRQRLEDGKEKFMNDAKSYGVTAFNKNKHGQVIVSERD